MRRVRGRADAFGSEQARLRPPFGTAGVGSAWFDPFLYGEALAELLRSFTRTRDVDASYAAAVEYARLCVRNWNARPQGVTIRGRHELIRSEDSAESIIMWGAGVLREAVRQSQGRATAASESVLDDEEVV
jgi:hypothetical protein